MSLPITNHFSLRSITRHAMILALAAHAACGGADTPTNPDPQNPQPTMSWAGTWNVELNYEAACDTGGGNIRRATHTQTNAMQITAGSGSALTADVGGYALSGTGSTTALTLSGQYPMKDHAGEVTSNVQADNNVTIKIDKVTDKNNATGAVSGNYKGRFASPCTVSSGGTVKLTR